MLLYLYRLPNRGKIYSSKSFVLLADGMFLRSVFRFIFWREKSHTNHKFRQTTARKKNRYTHTHPTLTLLNATIWRKRERKQNKNNEPKTAKVKKQHIDNHLNRNQTQIKFTHKNLKKKKNKEKRRYYLLLPELEDAHFVEIEVSLSLRVFFFNFIVGSNITLLIVVFLTE